MKKAYCVFENFSNESRNLFASKGIELVVNTTKDRPNGEELVSLLKEYDILIIGIFSKLTKEMLKYVKTPKIVATLSVGLDHINKAFLESPLVTVLNITTSNSISVAEHILSLILSLNKRVYESNHLVIEERGHRNNVHERPDDISGKTIGLIGAGNITREVIKIARVFNMDILCYTKSEDKHQDLLKYNIRFTSLDNLLKESDIVNISVPLNDETVNLISKEKVHLLKTTATFINTSRAEVVDNKALIEYAEKYDSFYIGLDIDLDNYKELFGKYRKNVIITPHIAGISKQAINRMDIELANKIIKQVEEQNDNYKK